VDPGVPFALVAAAQLLAAGAFLGLAGVFARAPLRGPGQLGSAAAAPGVAGALGVAVSAALAGARLGPAGSPALAYPAGAALRLRGIAGRLLAAGLLASGGADALAPAARNHESAAAGLLGVRIAGALLLLALLAYVARTSVLAKIVTAIGVGVLATAIGTACVVGTVVSDQLAADQAGQLRQAAVGAANDLTGDSQTAVQLAQLVASCPTAQLLTCAQGIGVIAPVDAFTAVVRPTGQVTFGTGADHLSAAALHDLGASAAVQQALHAPPRRSIQGAGFLLLDGTAPQLVAIGVASVGSPASVVVYGEQVDQTLLAQVKARSTFDGTVLTLPSGTPLASTLSAPAAAELARTARPLLTGLRTQGVATSRIGQGNTPAAAYVLLPSGAQRVAVLALSVSSATVLRSQRTVLDLLFTALLAVGVLVAFAAYGLGRRAVEPVRRLTGAARAVGAGDLTVRPQRTTADEVGELAAVFAAMTGNLETLTGDLRATAETEAATRARLGTVLDAIADALVVSDEAGTVDLANPAAVAMLGDVLGRPLTEVLGGRLPAGQHVVVGVHGPVPVAVARAALPGGRGDVHVLRDVTEARQLERAKTEFLSNVSHELRTPLTPIQGYADLLRRRPDLGPAQTQAMAESISDGARRMARVVGLLVDVAALDAGRIAPAPEVLRPAAVLEARLAAWRTRMPDRAADLRRRVSAGTPDLHADPVWLSRALDELVDNALTHTPPGTSVTLSATAGGPGRVLLAVRDTGPGLDQEAQAGLFADFEQVDGSATRSRDGLGLGLAFVRRVTLMLGATVSVNSRPRAGATFVLDLPAAAAPTRPRRSARARPARIGRTRPGPANVSASRAPTRSEEGRR
jgi:signal transduction histidine kinase/HAMP domain-containing protein